MRAEEIVSAQIVEIALVEDADIANASRVSRGNLVAR